jgi:hypothetical protein
MDQRGVIYTAPAEQVPPEDVERLNEYFEDAKAEALADLLSAAESLRVQRGLLPVDIA